MRAGLGDVFFGDEDTTVVKVGRNGISILLAYADGKPEADLLRDLDENAATSDGLYRDRPVVLSFCSMEQRL